MDAYRFDALAHLPGSLAARRPFLGLAVVAAIGARDLDTANSLPFSSFKRREAS